MTCCNLFDEEDNDEAFRQLAANIERLREGMEHAKQERRCQCEWMIDVLLQRIAQHADTEERRSKLSRIQATVHRLRDDSETDTE